jgi:hypothetical protein
LCDFVLLFSTNGKKPYKCISSFEFVFSTEAATGNFGKKRRMKSKEIKLNEAGAAAIFNRPSYRIYSLSIIAVFCFYTTIATAQLRKSQEKKFGIRITSTITGGGFGLLNSPQIFCEREAWHFHGGLLFQKGIRHVSGLVAGAEYSVIRAHQAGDDIESDWTTNTEFFFFARSIFQNNAFLGKAVADVEERAAPESAINFRQLKLRAAELYGGFGIRTKWTDYLRWTTSIGIGGFATAKNSYKLYRDNYGVAIILQTGIIFTIKKCK